MTSTDRLTGGSILFTGIELVGLPERRLARVRGTDISFVPRDPARSLDATLTIAHHLQTPLRRTMGFSRRASSSLSLELLARVGFTDPRALLDLYPADLTPFMAQRVLIAGAISCDPLLVVADNPTSSLRPNDAHAVVDLLHDLHQELALTLVIVTDSLSMVAQSCRQVAVVERGMIVEHASVAELLHSPQHEHSQRLVAARNADLAAE
ncbi:ABC-type dipeptide/oligopeptide/nickel transport system ATPase component [Cryobacterium sp. CG_9.6]|nr:ABC-type dipeptide/oligopeptide/nickel transport system ATPase component [Cryobacterium sp. CG_9.6]